MMNLSEKAQKLAELPYTTIIIRDRISEGEGYVYVAYHPELDGCMAQGETLVEAKAFLDEIRVDYLEHLLEHNLPVPRPLRHSVTIPQPKLVKSQKALFADEGITLESDIVVDRDEKPTLPDNKEWAF